MIPFDAGRLCDAARRKTTFYNVYQKNESSSSTCPYQEGCTDSNTGAQKSPHCSSCQTRGRRTTRKARPAALFVFFIGAIPSLLRRFPPYAATPRRREERREQQFHPPPPRGLHRFKHRSPEATPSDKLPNQRHSLSSVFNAPV